MEDVELAGVEAVRRKERRAPATPCTGVDVSRHGELPRGASVRPGTGLAPTALRHEGWLVWHALLPPRHQVAHLLQEESQGRHGMPCVMRCMYALNFVVRGGCNSNQSG